MKRAHCDLIKAWADGAEIQTNTDGRGWRDVPAPQWNPAQVYRIKSEKRVFRVSLNKANNGEGEFTWTADSYKQACKWEKSDSFIKWLTDWIEYEV